MFCREREALQSLSKTLHGGLIGTGEALVILEYLLTNQEAVQVAALRSEVGSSPVGKESTHILQVLTLDDVAHRRLDLDRLTAERKIELCGLQDEVDVGIPSVITVGLREQVKTEVIADASGLQVVVILGFFVVVVRINGVQQTGLCGRVEVVRNGAGVFVI